MSAKNKSQLLSELSSKVITGGNQTTASGVRALMSDVFDSFANIVDGGSLYQQQIGYTNPITLTNPETFTHKAYVDSAINVIANTYLPLIGGTMTGRVTFDNSSSGVKTYLYQNIANGLGCYLGIGNNSNLAAATSGSWLWFDNSEYAELRTTGLASGKYTNLAVGDSGIDMSSWIPDGSGGWYHAGIVAQDGEYLGVNSTHPNWIGAFYITDPETAGGFQTMSLVHKQYVDNAISTSASAYLPFSGGALTGPLTLNADPTTALGAVTKQYADALVVGLWDDRGAFDASAGSYPSTGGSGSAGAILKGDIWTISVTGTLPTGQVVEPGDTIRALINSPGNTQANWAIAQNNIGYTPLTNVLNSANIFVGNSSNIAAGVALSGDATITNTGVLNISKIGALTSNGFVKTSGGTGALSVDTNTYHSYASGTSQDGSLFFFNSGSTKMTSSVYCVFDGTSLFIETGTTTATAGIYFKDNSGIKRGGMYTIGNGAGNFTATSISSASVLLTDATATYVQRGTTLYNIIGTAGTNMGTSLDSSYFRVSAIQYLGTSTTSTSTYIAGALISVGATPVVGTGGYVASGFGSYNTRLLSTGLQTSYLSETAGLSGGCIVLRGYNSVAGSRQQLTLINYDGDFAGNYSGTSLLKANTLAIVGSNTGHGANGTGTLFKNSDILIFASGTSSTNSASRHDAAGFRIDSLANIHTSNTQLFSVVNATAGSFGISTAGIVTISANGAPLIVNSSNGAQSQITLQQVGIARGYIDANSTYNFMTEATGGANALRVSNSAVTGTLDINSTNLTILDAKDIVMGSTTGNKIGTATSQKIGFWNAAPVVQPTTSVATSAFVANTSGIVDDSATFGGYKISQIVKALQTIGLLA